MSQNDENTTMGKPRRSGANKAVAAGLAIGVLGGTAAGLVFGVPGLSNAAGNDRVAAPTALVQQVDTTDPTTPSTEPSTPGTDPVAPAPTDDHDPAEVGSRLRESLQPIVDDGTITAAQADAVVAQLKTSIPVRGDGEGRGPGGRGGRDGHGPGRFGRGADPQVLSTLLGLERKELMTQLRDGSTLAEVATAQGVEPQAVIDALVAEATTHLDEAVADGRMDQAEADQKLADATTRITDMVNNGRPDRAADDEQGD